MANISKVKKEELKNELVNILGKYLPKKTKENQLKFAQLFVDSLHSFGFPSIVVFAKQSVDSDGDKSTATAMSCEKNSINGGDVANLIRTIVSKLIVVGKESEFLNRIADHTNWEPIREKKDFRCVGGKSTDCDKGSKSDAIKALLSLLEEIK